MKHPLHASASVAFFMKSQGSKGAVFAKCLGMFVDSMYFSREKVYKNSESQAMR